MNDIEVQQIKQKLRQHRIRVNFDNKYHAVGGIKQFERMVEHTDTLEDMGKWFSLSSIRMGVIFSELYSMRYSDYLTSKNVQRSGVNHAR